jgi:hypothetical protein
MSTQQNTSTASAPVGFMPNIPPLQPRAPAIPPLQVNDMLGQVMMDELDQDSYWNLAGLIGIVKDKQNHNFHVHFEGGHSIEVKKFHGSHENFFWNAMNAKIQAMQLQKKQRLAQLTKALREGQPLVVNSGENKRARGVQEPLSDSGTTESASPSQAVVSTQPGAYNGIAEVKIDKMQE